MSKGGVSIFTLAKTIECVHYPAQKAMHAIWLSLSTPDFRAAIERGLNECGRLGALTWIVDLTRDPGVPSQADLRWLEEDTAELTRGNGLKGLVNIHGASAIAKMGSRRWTKSASENGMSVYDCASLDDALQLSAEIAKGKG
jgi:hypothetical protein